MADRKLIPAQTPDGQAVVVSVVDVDGTAAVATPRGDQKVAAMLPNLSGPLDSIKDFASGLQGALKAVAPDKTTVEFTVGFAVQAGKLTAMFVDGKADGSVTVTMEWGKDQ